ncbi:MAG: Ig-like domain-containing protein [Candidatus Limnocylindria bacterium]
MTRDGRPFPNRVWERLFVAAMVIVVVLAGNRPLPALASGDPPVAFDQSESTREGTPLAVFLSADDADFDTLKYTILSGPDHGSLDDCSSGVCTYTPASGPNYIGPDSFTWQANDGLSDSNVATFTIEVTANTAPVANDQSESTREGTPLSVFLSADDADFDTLRYTILSGPDHGSLDDCSSGVCTYTPSAGYIGPDSFTWQANDGLVNSNVATFAIKVVAGPAELAAAMTADPSVISGASFSAVPPDGTPNDVYASELSFFPTHGSTFSILTSGDASLADDANVSESSGASNGGGNIRGDTDFDVTILRIDLVVPTGTNCLRLDFAFYSDEFPEFVGSGFNDAFIAELDASTWATSGSAITAADNFAFDPDGNVISINSTGVTSMSAANAVGTTYDGATALLQAGTPITSGTHSLYLSIFDQGDMGYDSAVFLDNLRLLSLPSPETQCAEGAIAVNTPPSTDAGGPYTGDEGADVALDATLSDPDAGDTLTSTWSYVADTGVDAGASCSFADASAVDTSVSCTDDGSYTMTLTASDGVNSEVLDSATLSLANVDPAATITAPADGASFNIGETVALSADVSDAAANDSLSCSIDWGDGTIGAGSIEAGVCSASHAYAADGPVTVTVTVSDDDDGSGSDSVDISINPAPPDPTADLSVVQADTPDPVTSGNAVHYYLTVTNAGPDQATEVTLTDTLPAGSTVIANETPGCAQDGMTITCDLGTVASGVSMNVSIVVNAPTVSVVTVITNTATVSASELDPMPANNVSEEQTTVEPASDDPDSAAGWIPATGGTVSTGASKPPSKKDPMTTAVTVPPGFPGLVVITEGPITNCASGYRCFGQEANITAPTTAAETPLRLTFLFHSSILPPSTQLDEVVMFHDEELIERCTGPAGVAEPDPCIDSVRRVKGKLQIIVFSSENGTWRGGR